MTFHEPQSRARLLRLEILTSSFAWSVVISAWTRMSSNLSFPWRDERNGAIAFTVHLNDNRLEHSFNASVQSRRKTGCNWDVDLIRGMVRISTTKNLFYQSDHSTALSIYTPTCRTWRARLGFATIVANGDISLKKEDVKRAFRGFYE